MSISSKLESLRMALFEKDIPLGDLIEIIEDMKEEVEELEYRIQSLEK